jgi:uncharacterized protein YndB with AHSA1/START domain
MSHTAHMNDAIGMNDAIRTNDTIVVEIDIAAPPERVFEAWTDPQQRLEWWGDDAAYRGSKFESDLRVGGHWRTEGKGSKGQHFVVFGQYTRVEPPKALGFTWNHDWGGKAMPETHVLIELTPTSSGTHVSVTHSGFTDAGERDDHSSGWKRVLGWLRGYLQRA